MSRKTSFGLSSNKLSAKPFRSGLGFNPTDGGEFCLGGSEFALIQTHSAINRRISSDCQEVERLIGKAIDKSGCEAAVRHLELAQDQIDSRRDCLLHLREAEDALNEAVDA